MSDDFDVWKARRNRALIDLDERYVLEQFPSARPGVPLMILHKGRYECTDIPEFFRHESARWLRDHNLTRMDGSPVLPVGELPK